MLSREGFASGLDQGMQQEWLLGWGTQEWHHGAVLWFILHQGLNPYLLFQAGTWRWFCVTVGRNLEKRFHLDA